VPEDHYPGPKASSPIAAMDPWYDKLLYRLGIVRRPIHDRLWAAYTDVFGWWTKKIQAEMGLDTPEPENTVAARNRLYNAVMDPDGALADRWAAEHPRLTETWAVEPEAALGADPAGRPPEPETPEPAEVWVVGVLSRDQHTLLRIREVNNLQELVTEEGVLVELPGYPLRVPCTWPLDPDEVVRQIPPGYRLATAQEIHKATWMDPDDWADLDD
jgi:hypothetical protein